MKYLKICFLLAFSFLTGNIAIGQTEQVLEVGEIGLFPQQNSFRNKYDLSGMWNFKVDSLNMGEKESWSKTKLTNCQKIAVPGSWNSQLVGLDHYLGNAWYEKEFFVPTSWEGRRIMIRFGSATYEAKAWINGTEIGGHEGGHLPFSFEIGSYIEWGKENRLTVKVNNFLSPDRVPPGNVQSNGSFLGNNPPTTYDFFPYAGIDRQVFLYSVPQNHIRDLTIKTENIQDHIGVLKINVEKVGTLRNGKISIYDDDKLVQSLDFEFEKGSDTVSIVTHIANAQIWSVEDPFLYTLKVEGGVDRKILDEYSEKFGVRTIEVTEKELLLNGKPIILKGFGKHEDFPIFGKGTAFPVIAKDYSLLKWVGANAYRTSHYPYDEEYMRMADERGLLIIDEIPAVGLYFQKGDEANVEKRKKMAIQQIHELIKRDKNHPSVIVWSLANEPHEGGGFNLNGLQKASDISIDFFKELVKTAHQLDNSRPTTFAAVQGGPLEWLGLFDIISLNRYYGWYSQSGDLKAGAEKLSSELDQIHNQFNKPIVLTEFGADAKPGQHSIYPLMFTEEYQRDFIKTYLDVMDKKDFIAGTLVWAFADFKTAEGVLRFGSMNWKGVFTRDREPKLAAFYLHNRWGKSLK